MEKAIRFIDLFCGIGGFRHGLEKASQADGRHEGEHPDKDRRREGEGASGGPSVLSGRNSTNPDEQHGQCERRVYTCVWANDIDKYACQVYRRRFGNKELYEGDIRAVDVDRIPEHDLLCAGFPCQDFSVAGKRAGIEGTRGTLFFEICRVLRAKRPSYVFLENVQGLFSADDGKAFGIILSCLDELGYDCQWQMLNSKDYEVPQNRERVFIIGHLRDKPRPKVFPIGKADG
jgi:DNA (cytosine-5)-methyltransferase 1